ncbi:LysR family transcriptional regulator, partial [Acinetobacter oleivorans]|nr:LysR family transcriptional regulator [Acinetobacter oleivorans]
MLKRSNLKFKWIDLTLISSFDDFYYFYLVVKHGGFSAASEAENIS